MAWISKPTKTCARSRLLWIFDNTNNNTTAGLRLTRCYESSSKRARQQVTRQAGDNAGNDIGMQATRQAIPRKIFLTRGRDVEEGGTPKPMGKLHFLRGVLGTGNPSSRSCTRGTRHHRRARGTRTRRLVLQGNAAVPATGNPSAPGHRGTLCLTTRQSAVRDSRHLDHRPRRFLAATQGTRHRRPVHGKPAGVVSRGVDAGVARHGRRRGSHC